MARIEEKFQIQFSDLEKNKIRVMSGDMVKESLEGKGWNFNFVFYLDLLRDLYLIIYNSKNKTKKDVYNQLEKNHHFKGLKVNDKKRYIYEYENALICYKLIDYRENQFVVLQDDYFSSKSFNQPKLNSKDIESFKKIFFSYIRFKEIHNWFLKFSYSFSEIKSLNKEDLKIRSFPLFYSSLNPVPLEKKDKKQNLFDSFFFSVKPTKFYYINDGALQRFFEVYLKWGIELCLLEKINLSQALDMTAIFGSKASRNVNVVFFLSQSHNIDVMEYIKTNFQENKKSLHLPELIVSICLDFRIRVAEAKRLVEEQCFDYNEDVSIQRTSEVFIKGRESFFPKYNNSYVSHLLLR